jgi:choline dehydrogenase-like flavoprotein
MPQVVRSSPVYDVVVIGSGAGGGTVTKVLADLGISVLLMEAGPMFNPAKDIKEHMWPYQVPHRGVGPHGEGYFGRSPFTFSASFGGAQLDGEPYTVAPGSEFSWFRSRILGGRTNHYGRFSLRFADYDFKPHSRDGLGWDWPISYEDISPYYDKAETFIGVVGTKEGIRSAPDGIFQTPAAPKVHDILTKKACGKLGIPCIPMRSAIITRPTNGRAPCHYCGQCGRACMTASNYASSYVQIFPAMKTGRVKVIANAMARELLTDDAGKVRAVSYVDKSTRGEQQVRCRTVVLAASACESARLLLNSKSPRHPAGLANSSGVVGRYLTDTVGTGLSGHIPALEGLPHYNSDGYGTHMYIPWWLWDKQKDLGFPRGYHVELGGGFGMPAVGSFQATCQRHEGYGLGLKKAIRDDYGTSASFSGRGEMIPNENSYCEIDPQMVDRWGIPVLRFHWEWSEHELKQAEHQVRTFAEIIQAMGGTVTGARRGGAVAGGGAGGAAGRQVISRGGAIIHEIGTVRMGADPKTSVLNRHCQAHEVKNLFVADGGPFVSNPDKNPTLTIIALAWRTAEYLAEEMRKGNV